MDIEARNPAAEASEEFEQSSELAKDAAPEEDDAESVDNLELQAVVTEEAGEDETAPTNSELEEPSETEETSPTMEETSPAMGPLKVNVQLAEEIARNKRGPEDYDEDMKDVLSPTKKLETEDDDAEEEAHVTMIGAIELSNSTDEYDPNTDPVIVAARARRKKMEENMERTKKMMEDMRNGLRTLTSNIDQVKTSFQSINERADQVLKQSEAHRDGLVQMKETMIKMKSEEAEREAKFKGECDALKEKIMGIIEQEKQSLAKIQELSKEQERVAQLTEQSDEKMVEQITSNASATMEE